MAKVKVGSFVRFNANGGSIGKVTGEHPSVPNYFYAEWVYGRDVNGNVMTATSGGLKESSLAVITEAEYNAVRDRKGFKG